MNTPKVSILIPCYNSEKYVAETLKSCVSQTYTNIEIIVVDDGSTDNSVEIVRDWAIRYTNIYLYTQSNSGVCRARNLAFEKSTGNYILYLDADDIISCDMVYGMLDLIKEYDSNTIATCSWGRFSNSIDDFRIENQQVYRDYDSVVDLIGDLLNDSMFGLSCYLTPREIIEEAGLWNEDLSINTDGEFFIRVLANAKRVVFSNHGCLFYRSSNPNSISRRKPTESKGYSLLLSYQLIRKFLVEKKMITKRILLGLQKSFQSVAYQYVVYDEILQSAKEQVTALGVKGNTPNIGGRWFRLLCSCFGFWNILKLRQIINRLL